MLTVICPAHLPHHCLHTVHTPWSVVPVLTMEMTPRQSWQWILTTSYGILWSIIGLTDHVLVNWYLTYNTYWIKHFATMEIEELRGDTRGRYGGMVLRRISNQLTHIYLEMAVNQPLTSMFPHYPAVFIFTPVSSVILGLPWRSLWLKVWAHLWCNRGWITPTPLCMECQHLTCTNYSLPKILSLVWFCLLFAIFQQVSDSVTSTGFPLTTEYSSKSLHLSIRP